jgi:hypothetical protein
MPGFGFAPDILSKRKYPSRRGLSKVTPNEGVAVGQKLNYGIPIDFNS